MGKQRERKRCKNLRIALADIEKRLPALKKKAIDNQSKSESIEKRLPELERELAAAKVKCKALEAEIEKSLAELNGQLGPSWSRVWYRIQKGYRTSKTQFAVALILLATLLAFWIVHNEDNKLGSLILITGSSISLLLLGISHKKYLLLFGWVIIAFILFLISIYTSGIDDKRYYLTIGFAVLALGFAMHTFFSGEYLEAKLDDINKKISLLKK